MKFPDPMFFNELICLAGKSQKREPISIALEKKIVAPTSTENRKHGK